MIVQYLKGLGCSNSNIFTFVWIYIEQLSDLKLFYSSFFFTEYRLLQVICLSNIGGRHIDEFTRRVMSFLMANDLAMQFNMFGRK